MRACCAEDFSGNGYRELPVTGEHAVATTGLPHLHKDPFDRLLIAQSIVEGITLLTTDPQVAKYPAPVHAVSADAAAEPW